MKKIFALIACLLMLAVPLGVSAEEATETQGKSEWEEIKDTVSGALVQWVEPNLEEIGVITTLVGYGIIVFKRLRAVNKAMGTMNNNAITISKENASFMGKAVTSIDNASTAVTGFEAKINMLLDAYQQTAEEKKILEKELVEIKNYLKISADANLEFSNELAELLGLANIPNYIKEEIGKRHVQAKNNILEAEKKAEELLLSAPEEVKEDVGEDKEG